MQSEMRAVEHDQPGARAEHRRPARRQRAQRLGEALALDPERHRRRLAAGHHEAVEPVELGRRCGPRAPSAPSARSSAHVGRRSRPEARGRRSSARRPTSPYQPRAASSCSLVELARLERRHRAAEALGGLGDALGVGEVRRRLDDRAARGARGPRDLKMPEPTNTPSAPSCITSEASAGVAMPPAQNSGTGSRRSRRRRARGRAARRAPWRPSTARSRRACRGGGSRR